MNPFPLIESVPNHIRFRLGVAALHDSAFLQAGASADIPNDKGQVALDVLDEEIALGGGGNGGHRYVRAALLGQIVPGTADAVPKQITYKPSSSPGTVTRTLPYSGSVARTLPYSGSVNRPLPYHGSYTRSSRYYSTSSYTPQKPLPITYPGYA